MVGVVSLRLSNTLMSPLFSPTKTRPSTAKRKTVGLLRPLIADDSANPDGSVAASARRGGSATSPTATSAVAMMAETIRRWRAVGLTFISSPSTSPTRTLAGQKFGRSESSGAKATSPTTAWLAGETEARTAKLHPTQGERQYGRGTVRPPCDRNGRKNPARTPPHSQTVRGQPRFRGDLERCVFEKRM